MTTRIERLADQPVVLIGHAWGAWLIAIVAAEHPNLVRKLILVGSGAFARGGWNARALRNDPSSNRSRGN